MSNHLTAVGVDLGIQEDVLLHALGDTFTDTLPLLGILGREDLEPYLAQLDYATRQLILVPLDAAGRPVVQVLPAPTDSATLRVVVQGLGDSSAKELHVSGTVGGKTVWWTLDTGADMTLIEGVSTLEAMGMGRHVFSRRTEPGEYVLDTLLVGTLHAVSESVTVAQSQASDAQALFMSIMGNTLGVPFFTRQPFAINQRAGKLYFWPPNRRDSSSSDPARVSHEGPANVGPLLTLDALTRLTTFWTSFTQEPLAIRDTARTHHQKPLVCMINMKQVAVLRAVDLVAMAAAYPSVAADLKRAGLTAVEWEDYRRALFNALFAQSQQAVQDGRAVMPTSPTSVLGRNVAFLRSHQAEVTALRATGMWLPWP